MSVRGKWRVVEIPDYDMALSGRLHPVRQEWWGVRLQLSHGSIHGVCEGDAVEFTWQGNDEMEPASGRGWAELQDDGSLEGEICLDNGDDISFIARR